jgi:3-deoxy-D-manno-octulosonate 8-phosphate phosphatase (KDO 8-P phosphatase)
LQRAGVAVAIISGRASAAVTHRACELGIAHVRQGISDKGAALDALW